MSGRMGSWVVIVVVFGWMAVDGFAAALIDAESDHALSPRVAHLTAAFRGEHPVRATPDGTIFAEAEEFQIRSPGWQAKDWGENYYCASFANTFLSRKAFLGAPEEGPRTEASLTVEVPQAGRYLALIRYEAAYRFETQFTLRIEQGGEVKLARLYGARENPKIWAFREKIKTEWAWPWGAVEKIVWEGHETFVELDEGLATLTLIADAQPEPAARRNVDVIMLTTDHEQVAMRIERENYLPLDGMLTQAGDVYVKFENAGETPVTITIPAGREHSPYNMHLRQWQARRAQLAPGESSDWIEVGGVLDTLNDGRWLITATPDPRDAAVSFTAEFALDDAAGNRETIARFVSEERTLRLAYEGNTRYSRRIRPYETVLDDVLEYLEAHPLPGRPPRRMIVYGYTFDPIEGNDEYNAKIERFVELFGLARLYRSEHAHLDQPSGYIWPNPAHLDALAESWREQGVLEKIRVINRGDEISLARPPAGDHERYRAWARERGLTPQQLGVEDWDAVEYRTAADASRTDPVGYYYSRRYAQAFGIAQQRRITERFQAILPNADTGANFSPHHGGAALAYVGEAHKWITLFREGGLTMPWSEDYIWQLPVGSQQMNFLLLDLFRAGVRYRPEADIHFYVMPHWPGNRLDSWRRLWYGSLGSGMTIGNLFEFRPTQASYTENYVNYLPMYQEVRRGLYETAGFEDIVVDGQVRWGNAALWYSDSGDAWWVNRPPFGANKRSLYVAIRHRQLALDVVDEEDALRGTLDGYKVLYLTDTHVSDVASRAIADWVAAGGRLLATAGGGMFNHYNAPNETLRALFGITPAAMETPDDSRVGFEKQDLPFARVFDRVSWTGLGEGMRPTPVVGARQRFETTGDEVDILGVYEDGSPAVSRRNVGQGQAIYAGFPVGLSYFHPAIPRRPMDRAITEDAMAHFIPTDFDAGAAALVGLPAVDVARPVTVSAPLVQASIIESPHGLAIPLVNWSNGPQAGLIVSIDARDARGRVATLAGGGEVRRLDDDPAQPGRARFQIDLEVADALLLRPARRRIFGRRSRN